MVGAAAEPPQNGLPTGVKRAAEAQAPTALTALIPPGPVAHHAALTVIGAGGGAKHPSPLLGPGGQLYFLLPGNCPLLAVGLSLTPGYRVSISRSSPCVTDSHSSRCTWFILPLALRFPVPA